MQEDVQISGRVVWVVVEDLCQIDQTDFDGGLWGTVCQHLVNHVEEEGRVEGNRVITDLLTFLSLRLTLLIGTPFIRILFSVLRVFLSGRVNPLLDDIASIEILQCVGAEYQYLSLELPVLAPTAHFLNGWHQWQDRLNIDPCKV
jgi:hypothetical protein